MSVTPAHISGESDESGGDMVSEIDLNPEAFNDRIQLRNMVEGYAGEEQLLEEKTSGGGIP